MTSDFRWVLGGKGSEVFNPLQVVAAKDKTLRKLGEAEPLEAMIDRVGIEGVVEVKAVYQDVNFRHKNKTQLHGDAGASGMTGSLPLG